MKFDNNKPIFAQISDNVCNSILSGEMKAGDRVLSVRELSAKIQVNPNTVLRAYSELQETGLIEQQRGIGYFVTRDAKRIVRRLKRKEFEEKYLPELFELMDAFEIDGEYLQNRYGEYKAAKEKSDETDE